MCAGAEIVQDHLTGLKEFVLDQLKPEEPKPAEETATDGMFMASRDGLTFFTWQELSSGQDPSASVPGSTATTT